MTTETECLFCKMVRGEINPQRVYEDEHLLAFHDINPQAPVHILLIPKQHIATLNDLQNKDLAGRLLTQVGTIATQENIAEDGYRTVINCNQNSGQEVFHLHLHILGGRRLNWPPG